MHARLRGSKSLFTVYQIINKHDFPSLADEIVETHPDMNIKVAAFTVSKKSINILEIIPRMSFSAVNVIVFKYLTENIFIFLNLNSIFET